MRVLRPVAFASVAMLLAAACRLPGSVPEAQAVAVDLTGLERVANVRDAIVYRRPGSRDLAEFRRFIVDPVEVALDESELTPDTATASSLAGYVREAVVIELLAGGYGVVQRPGQDVLRVRLHVVARVQRRPVAEAVSALFLLDSRSVQIETEFYDSLSGVLGAVSIMWPHPQRAG